MKTIIVGILSLLTGGGIGYLVGNKVATKKYKDLADKEVESVKASLKAYYEEKMQNGTTIKKGSEAVNDKKDDKPKKKNPLMDKDSIDYDMLKEEKHEYMKYVKPYISENNVKEGEPEDTVGINPLKPYLISSEEYSESDYNAQTLHWYRDGVLCDDEYNVIKDIHGTVGDEALNSFGLYQEDAVYVRNDQHKIDYEILLEDDDYSRVAPKETLGVFPGDDDE